MFKKILKTLFGLSLCAGMVLVLCAAGSSDANSLDWESIKTLIGISAVLMTTGFAGLKIMNPDF